MNASLGKLYKSFEGEKSRAQWLAEDGFIVRKATADKSMRVTWKDGKTSMEVNFYSKSDDKSQVVVQHSKLPDAKGAAKMNAYWGQALERLRKQLEK